MELGTVIATGGAPTPSEFSFVVTAEGKLPVRKGQFVELNTEEGKVLAFVTNLVKTNRYFMRAESVKEYERGSGALTWIFPVDRWEYLVAQARTLGVLGENGLERMSFPPSPGQKVYSPESGELARFLGLSAGGGISVGELKHHALPVRLDLTRLLRKHVAILAMSGAGKCLSYETPVLLTSGNLIPIGELVEKAMERGKEVEDGIEFTVENPANLSVYSLDSGFKLREKRIGAFIRRKFSGELLKIELKSGNELLLTENHPLLKFDGRAHWVPVRGLKVGDKIAAPRVAPPSCPDLVWDEVTGIGGIENSCYVYDLSVEGSNNFVAGNVIVHNSHLASVVVEELLGRKPSECPAIVVVDVHGEYTSLAEPWDGADYSSRVRVIRGDELRVGVPNLSSRGFKEFVPELSGTQARELQRVIDELKAEMRSGKGPFGLEEIAARVEGEEGMHKHLRQALLGWLYDLHSLGVFDRVDYPDWEKVLHSGEAVVLDLSDVVSLRKKQILVAHTARRLFNERKRGRVPPFVLCLEEAHQFCPSTESKTTAISRPVIETIAREGRKFYASLMLISQRPVRLSTTVLSQASTNIILRITNPYDLEHIKQSSEAITGEVADMISSLPVGEALIVGEAVNHPIFVKVGRRRSKELMRGGSLEEAVLEFERRNQREREDAKAFM